MNHQIAASDRRIVVTVIILCWALIVVGFISGCSTRTVGMQAPLAHDYDGLRWNSVETDIYQRIVVAPAYTALVENDPSTDQATLLERIDRLPADVRQSQLAELRVALRPGERGQFDDDLTVRITNLDTGEDVRFAAAASKFARSYLIISELPEAHVGQVLEVEILPGSPGDTGWEFGLVAGRLPYGGDFATAGGSGSAGQAINGSVAFQTVFDQETDASGIVSSAGRNGFQSLTGDWLLVIVYLLAGCAAVFFWARSFRLRRLG